MRSEIEKCAARFLMRRDEPDWSPQNELELERWLQESAAHKAAFWRLQHGWEQADRIRSLNLPPIVDAAWMQPLLTRWRSFAVAASLLLAIIIGSFPMWNTSRAQRERARYATLVGQRGVMPLPDGTKLELNTDTSVQTDLSNKRREVWLERGEAYFEVAHDPRRPFIVHAGKGSVTVLGTKFAVRREAGKLTVSVIEGRVQLDPDDIKPGGSAILEGGDIAVARGAATVISSGKLQNARDSLGWREGMVLFRGTTLKDAVAEFNRYNRRQLVITDPDAASIRIGGSFRVSNMEAFARLLNEAFGLHIERTADRIFISRNSRSQEV